MANSLVARMAEERHIDAATFFRTIKSTLMPSGATDEQIAAFLLVAERYKLDPITREIFAFPARKGSGIMPVLSIDGWVKLVNSHPQSDGFEFQFGYDERGKLDSCTCRMHRKDRTNPVAVTEFIVECYRNTDAWNLMPRRMLRHKAFKEAARYCFGFSGLTDEDEANDVRAIGPINGGTIIDGAEVDPLDQWANETEAENENQDQESDDATPGSGTPSPDQSNASAVAADADQAAADPASAVSGLDKRELVDQLIRYATSADSGDEQDKLEWLDNLQPAYRDRLEPDFTRALFSTITKVVKGELKADAAKKYLASL